jgi:hypothetical protein
VTPKKVAGKKVNCGMSAAKEIGIVQRSEEHSPKPSEEAGDSMSPAFTRLA